MINLQLHYNASLIIHLKAMMKSAGAAIGKQQQSAAQPYRQHTDNTACRQFLPWLIATTRTSHGNIVKGFQSARNVKPVEDMLYCY